MSINPFVTDNILCALQGDLKWNFKGYFFQMHNRKILKFKMHVIVVKYILHVSNMFLYSLLLTQWFVSIRYLRILTRLLSNHILNFHGSLDTKPLSNKNGKNPIRITWDVEGLNQTGIDKSNTKVDNPYHLFPLNWRSIKGFIWNRKLCIIHSEIYLHPFFIVKIKNISKSVV